MHGPWSQAVWVLPFESLMTCGESREVPCLSFVACEARTPAAYGCSWLRTGTSPPPGSSPDSGESEDEHAEAALGWRRGAESWGQDGAEGARTGLALR